MASRLLPFTLWLCQRVLFICLLLRSCAIIVAQSDWRSDTQSPWLSLTSPSVWHLKMSSPSVSPCPDSSNITRPSEIQSLAPAVWECQEPSRRLQHAKAWDLRSSASYQANCSIATERAIVQRVVFGRVGPAERGSCYLSTFQCHFLSHIICLPPLPPGMSIMCCCGREPIF